MFYFSPYESNFNCTLPLFTISYQSMDIGQLRKEYSCKRLLESEVPEDPFDLFKTWFDQAIAAELLEPNAMVLATVDAEQLPNQRTVLLKKLDASGFVFFTNYSSQKSKELDHNPKASVLFQWLPLERQLKIRGTVKRIAKSESLSYFLSRPFGSQLGAWVSRQSSVISSRQILEMKLDEVKRKFADGKVPLPDFWGGYRIIPQQFEFWQGGPNRLHDRIAYERLNSQNSPWKISRLAP